MKPNFDFDVDVDCFKLVGDVDCNDECGAATFV